LLNKICCSKKKKKKERERILSPLTEGNFFSTFNLEIDRERRKREKVNLRVMMDTFE
jgi:hypothetical protein